MPVSSAVPTAPNDTHRAANSRGVTGKGFAPRKVVQAA